MTTGRQLLGASLRARRTRAGLHLAEVAARAGMSEASLSFIERGLRLPSLQSLDRLATAFETTAAELLLGVYPWGSSAPPDEPPAKVPDGRTLRGSRRQPPP